MIKFNKIYDLECLKKDSKKVIYPQHYKSLSQNLFLKLV